MLKCLEVHNLEKVWHDIDDRPHNRHFTGNKTTHKFMCIGFYWLTLFKYSHAYAFKCLICQMCVDWDKKSTTPLQPITLEEPFQ